MARFTRREWKTLLILALAYISTGLSDSVPPPFYPPEAESKGATATEYGLVFGIFQFIFFVTSPILGKYMDFLGAVFLLRTGAFVIGTSMIFFGLLDLVNGHDAFIGLSFVLRIVWSLGASAKLTSTVTISATVFPESVATTFATLEVLYGLGLIIGPTVGALLFTLGGYMAPFFAVGAFLIMTGLLVCFFLPPLDGGDSVLRQQPQLCTYLRLTPVLLDSFAVVAASIATGFYVVTLEPHIRQYGLTTLSTGAIFAIQGITFAITAPLVGRLCDKCVSPRTVIVVGAILDVLSFALVGPLPFTNIPSVLWLCCLGLVLEGLSRACLLVSAFVDGIRSAVEAGLPDDITTYGVISGLWASSLALGACIGSSVAGILYDHVGFRMGSLFVICTHLLLMLSMVTFVATRRRPFKQQGNDKTTYGTMPDIVLRSTFLRGVDR